MADIEIKRVHNLGAKAARAAADKMAEHLGKKFGLAGEWRGNVLAFERPGVSGTLAVNDKDLALSVSLGFLLKAMKGSIEAAVRQEMDKLFAHATARPSPRASPEGEREKPKAKRAAARPKKAG